MLAGDFGPATQMAMRILATMAGVYGAPALLDIESAHIDGCLYHGYSGLEFARRLVNGGAQVVVPTTLNVGAVDLLHPEYFRGSAEVGRHATELMAAYESRGGPPIWTCAPYQTAQRPAFGTQIAWAESNAIVFANSVLGARTNRYGDFIDICAAITGRAPAVGLHLTENRRAQILFRLEDLPERLLHEDVLYPVLGYFIGARAGTKIPAIAGLSSTTTEDQLKALGAATASSGAVALFHAIGVTPEAPTLEEAFHGKAPEQEIAVTLDDLRALGVQVVVDTCVVVTPLVRARQGVLMTNSGKFAHYTPGNIGLQVAFGSLEECVRSGANGQVWRDESLWQA